VFNNLELGGAERQGLMLARFLRERYAADVRILGLHEAPGRLSQLCDQAGLPWKGIRVSWQWGLRHVFTNLRELQRIAAALRQEKPDLLLPYTFFPNVVCGLVWRCTGAKLCIWNQRDEGRFLEPEPWRGLASRLTPYFLANSEDGREALLHAFAVSPDKIAVVPNGVVLDPPLADRREWRERLNLADDVFAACMVANIHEYKDHPTLLRAWRSLADLLPQGVPAPVLLLAGRVDHGEFVHDLAASLGLNDCVRFLGAIGDVAGLLRAVDLCVHSSRTEGLPNAVLEAMASGLAVVATDIPGIREAVGGDGYRFLVPAGDPQALAELIAKFIREPALCRTLGERMRMRVSELFDANASCLKVAGFIEGRWP